MKIVVAGCKVSVLWSQIAFYGSVDVTSLNEIYDPKTDDLSPQITILKTLIP